jgi:hypothetical protein
MRDLVGLMTISGARAMISGRAPVELLSSTTAADGRPVRHPYGPVEEVEALAVLLAEVVKLAEDRAMFPGRFALIAELALNHKSVRRALRGENQR